MIQYIIQRDFWGFLFVIVVLLVALTLHEFAHALAADLQGDPTARLAGRLSLNPAAHIDPIGAFAFILVGFGWGKPVPFSAGALRSRRFGAAIVAIAGPATNVLLACVGALGFVVFQKAGGFSNPAQGAALLNRFLQTMVYLNVLLAIFNMLPVPPLDGSRLLTIFLPPSRRNIIFFLDKWGFAIIFIGVFLFRGILAVPASSLSLALLRLFGAQV